VGGCPCCRRGEEQTWSSGFSGRWGTGGRPPGRPASNAGPAGLPGGSRSLYRGPASPARINWTRAGRPAAHLGKFGDRVRGDSPDRPHAGETPASWQRSSPSAPLGAPARCCVGRLPAAPGTARLRCPPLSHRGRSISASGSGLVYRHGRAASVSRRRKLAPASVASTSAAMLITRARSRVEAELEPLPLRGREHTAATRTRPAGRRPTSAIPVWGVFGAFGACPGSSAPARGIRLFTAIGCPETPTMDTSEARLAWGPPRGNRAGLWGLRGDRWALRAGVHHPALVPVLGAATPSARPLVTNAQCRRRTRR
jgi:hypothetical protein